MCITNRSPEKFEASLFHILAHCIRFGRRYRYLTHRPDGVDNRFSVWEKRKRVIVKTAEFLLDGEE